MRTNLKRYQFFVQKKKKKKKYLTFAAFASQPALLGGDDGGDSTGNFRRFVLLPSDLFVLSSLDRIVAFPHCWAAAELIGEGGCYSFSFA